MEIKKNRNFIMTASEKRMVFIETMVGNSEIVRDFAESSWLNCWNKGLKSAPKYLRSFSKVDNCFQPSLKILIIKFLNAASI